MTERPAASVIVATHGGAHRLPTLLAQLAAQDADAAWELVVVVDGVLDDTPRLLGEWDARAPLTVVTHAQAEGVARALSDGFAAASGTYLIRCDDDLDVPPTFVSAHLAAQAGRRDRVVLSLTRDVFPDTPYARTYGRPANERALTGYYAQRPEFRWIHVAACFSLHRDLWAASGGFDPRFAYGEDSEFGYRLWRSGATIVIDPALEVGHRGPAVSAATRVPRAFVSGASRRLFATVHPDAARPAARPRGWKALTWWALVAAASSVVRSPRGFGRLGALADALLPVLPWRIGGTLVALFVEAAGRSGQRHGSTDLHSYRSQKDAERRRELRRPHRSTEPRGSATVRPPA